MNLYFVINLLCPSDVSLMYVITFISLILADVMKLIILANVWLILQVLVSLARANVTELRNSQKQAQRLLKRLYPKMSQKLRQQLQRIPNPKILLSLARLAHRQTLA